MKFETQKALEQFIEINFNKQLKDCVIEANLMGRQDFNLILIIGDNLSFINKFYLNEESIRYFNNDESSPMDYFTELKGSWWMRYNLMLNNFSDFKYEEQ